MLSMHPSGKMQVLQVLHCRTGSEWAWNKGVNRTHEWTFTTSLPRIRTKCGMQQGEHFRPRFTARRYEEERQQSQKRGKGSRGSNACRPKPLARARPRQPLRPLSSLRFSDHASHTAGTATLPGCLSGLDLRDSALLQSPLLQGYTCPACQGLEEGKNLSLSTSRRLIETTPPPPCKLFQPAQVVRTALQ